MKTTTLEWIRCPKRKSAHRTCGGILKPSLAKKIQQNEITSGILRCAECSSRFPVLAGVAVLVDDPRTYILEHAQGIARHVRDSEIPDEWRKEYLRAKFENAEHHHIDESLESDRVNALYLATHFLSARDSTWWKDPDTEQDPLLDALMEKHWDHGPMQRATDWIGALPGVSKNRMIAELGCGTGGLRWKADAHLRLYIGVDSSFSSIAHARAMQGLKQIEIPGDLLYGVTSRKVRIQLPSPRAESDFVVGDLRVPPLVSGSWDCVVSMNTIDMLERPEDLPRVQSTLLKTGGYAIQSSPYVWHPQVAKNLVKKWGKSATSAQTVEKIYESFGLSIVRSESRIPWLFFKHDRQLEIYWTHLFSTRKGSSEA